MQLDNHRGFFWFFFICKNFNDRFISLFPPQYLNGANKFWSDCISKGFERSDSECGLLRMLTFSIIQ